MAGATPANLYNALCLVCFPQDGEHGSISGATPVASLYNAFCLVCSIKMVSMDPYLVLHLSPACITLYVWFIPSVQ